MSEAFRFDADESPMPRRRQPRGHPSAFPLIVGLLLLLGVGVAAAMYFGLLPGRGGGLTVSNDAEEVRGLRLTGVRAQHLYWLREFKEVELSSCLEGVARDLESKKCIPPAPAIAEEVEKLAILGCEKQTIQLPITLRKHDSQIQARVPEIRVEFPPYDRSTAVGRRNYEEFDLLYPSYRRLAASVRNLTIARRLSKIQAPVRAQAVAAAYRDLAQNLANIERRQFATGGTEAWPTVSEAPIPFPKPIPLPSVRVGDITVKAVSAEYAATEPNATKEPNHHGIVFRVRLEITNTGIAVADVTAWEGDRSLAATWNGGRVSATGQNPVPGERLLPGGSTTRTVDIKADDIGKSPLTIESRTEPTFTITIPPGSWEY